MLDDYAAMACAALALFAATGEPRYLTLARNWASEAGRRFGDAGGGVFMSAHEGADALIVRVRPPHDGATPSGASLLAAAFAALSHLTLEPSWSEAALRLARVHGAEGAASAQTPLLLSAIDLLHRGGALVVEGPLKDAGAIALADVGLTAADPAIVVLRLDPSLWPDGPPGGRSRLPSPPAAMLCHGQICSLPVGDVAALRTLMASA
jgi:uncharacterized protein YyaL (SSP411 family)